MWSHMMESPILHRDDIEIDLMSWCQAGEKRGTKMAKAFQRGRMAQTRAKRGEIK